MIKVIQLVRKKPEVSFEDFENQLRETYLKALRKAKGLRSLTINSLKGVEAAEEKPLDYIIEADFTSEKTLQEAFENPEIRSALEELRRVAEQPDPIYAEESVLKKPRAAAKPKPTKARKAGKPAKKAKKKAKRSKKKRTARKR